MHLINSGGGQRHLNEGSMDAGNITLYKNFFFKQDDLNENAEDLVTCSGFPQYGDPYNPLSTSFGFSLKCSHVDIAKLASEEQDVASGNAFMWVVKASYTDASTSNVSNTSISNIDPTTGNPVSDTDSKTVSRKGSQRQAKKWDGTPVTEKNTAPWEIESEIHFTHFDIDQLLTKGYDEDTLSATIPIQNTAGDIFPVETTLQGVEITWDLARPIGSYLIFPAAEGVVNDATYNLFGFSFPKGTLLCLPWAFDKHWTYIRQANGRMVVKSAYIVKHMTLRYSPIGWKLDLLNVGTRAKMPTLGYDFYGGQWRHYGDILPIDPMPTQAYLITYGHSIGSDASNTVRIQDGRLYGNAKILDEGYQWAQHLNDAGVTLVSGDLSGGYWVNGDIVTEPLPLASDGTIKTSAQQGDFSDVDTLYFNRYPYFDFSNLDLWGAP